MAISGKLSTCRLNLIQCGFLTAACSMCTSVGHQMDYPLSSIMEHPDLPYLCAQLKDRSMHTGYASLLPLDPVTDPQLLNQDGGLCMRLVIPEPSSSTSGPIMFRSRAVRRRAARVGLCRKTEGDDRRPHHCRRGAL